VLACYFTWISNNHMINAHSSIALDASFGIACAKYILKTKNAIVLTKGVTHRKSYIS